jgi:hypothetical protein
MIVSQNLYLQHTYGQCLGKPHLWKENYQTFHMVHKYDSNYV